MKIEIYDFNKFIKNIIFFRSSVSYSGNSMDIILDNERGEKLYHFFINPPYRLILNNKIIMTSSDYPFPENYPNISAKEKRNINKWYGKTGFMKWEKIKEIKILETCDLIITWENGAILNKFTNNIENNDDLFGDYFLWDDVNNKTYNFTYRKIIKMYCLC